MFVPITFARDLHVGIYTHFSQRQKLNSYPNFPFKLNYVYKLANKEHHLPGTKVKYSLISREIFLLVKIHLATEHCLMVAILITGGLGDTRESKSIIQIYPSHQSTLLHNFWLVYPGQQTFQPSGPAKRRVMNWRVISESYYFEELCPNHAQFFKTATPNL